MGWRIVEGDCVESMAAMADASVDAVVCDPPYGLEFMGKEWDRFGGDTRQRDDESFSAGNRRHGLVRHGIGASYRGDSTASMRAFQAWCESWGREALRVLKPGGHALVFGGTRTYHRLTCGLEDAGFEIRDCLSWLYGSGFPKSLDVGKAIDKAAGAEREVIGRRTDGRYASGFSEQAKKALGGVVAAESDTGFSGEMGVVTRPATAEALAWDGWGTALKPAWEPIVVARKPLAGTVAGNVLAHGTGALNVDGCRIAVGPDDPVNSAVWTAAAASSFREGSTGVGFLDGSAVVGDRRSAAPPAGGRWPANVLLAHAEGCTLTGSRSVKADGHYPAARGAGSDVSGPSGHGGQDGLAERSMDGETVEVWACVAGCPVRMLDEQTGELPGGSFPSSRNAEVGIGPSHIYGAAAGVTRDTPIAMDSGGASRFFYTAKTSTGERNAGLDDFEALWAPTMGNGIGGKPHDEDVAAPKRNVHPTVKPVELMRWLVRLVTPPGGTVLDPFTGSGSTGIAAVLEGFDFVGLEREPEYVAIAEARIGWWERHRGEGSTSKVLDAAQARHGREQGGQESLFA